MRKPLLIFMSTVLLAACTPQVEEVQPLTKSAWALNGEDSRLSFVSIKAGEIAEANRFTGLSGGVAADGKVDIAVDLASVDTGIDVRDQRLRDFLFEIAQNPEAAISAQLDPAGFADLGIGERREETFEVNVMLKGVTVPFEVTTDVMRIAADRLVVTSVAPVLLDANFFELGEGLAKLQELASLPSISSAVPVTFSLSFERQAQN